MCFQFLNQEQNILMPRVNSWLRAQPALHPTPAQLQGSVPGGIPRLEALSCSTDGQLCFEIWMELLPKKKTKLSGFTYWVITDAFIVQVQHEEGQGQHRSILSWP